MSKKPENIGKTEELLVTRTDQYIQNLKIATERFEESKQNVKELKRELVSKEKNYQKDDLDIENYKLNFQDQQKSLEKKINTTINKEPSAQEAELIKIAKQNLQNDAIELDKKIDQHELAQKEIETLKQKLSTQEKNLKQYRSELEELERKGSPVGEKSEPGKQRQEFTSLEVTRNQQSSQIQQIKIPDQPEPNSFELALASKQLESFATEKNLTPQSPQIILSDQLSTPKAEPLMSKDEKIKQTITNDDKELNELFEAAEKSGKELEDLVDKPLKQPQTFTITKETPPEPQQVPPPTDVLKAPTQNATISGGTETENILKELELNFKAQNSQTTIKQELSEQAKQNQELDKLIAEAEKNLKAPPTPKKSTVSLDEFKELDEMLEKGDIEREVNELLSTSKNEEKSIKPKEQKSPYTRINVTKDTSMKALKDTYASDEKSLKTNTKKKIVAALLEGNSKERQATRLYSVILDGKEDIAKLLEEKMNGESKKKTTMQDSHLFTKRELEEIRTEAEKVRDKNKPPVEKEKPVTKEETQEIKKPTSTKKEEPQKERAEKRKVEQEQKKNAREEKKKEREKRTELTKENSNKLKSEIKRNREEAKTLVNQGIEKIQKEINVESKELKKLQKETKNEQKEKVTQKTKPKATKELKNQSEKINKPKEQQKKVTSKEKAQGEKTLERNNTTIETAKKQVQKLEEAKTKPIKVNKKQQEKLDQQRDKQITKLNNQIKNLELANKTIEKQINPQQDVKSNQPEKSEKPLDNVINQEESQKTQERQNPKIEKTLEKKTINDPQSNQQNVEQVKVQQEQLQTNEIKQSEPQKHGVEQKDVQVENKEIQSKTTTQVQKSEEVKQETNQEQISSSINNLSSEKIKLEQQEDKQPLQKQQRRDDFERASNKELGIEEPKQQLASEGITTKKTEEKTVSKNEEQKKELQPQQINTTLEDLGIPQPQTVQNAETLPNRKEFDELNKIGEELEYTEKQAPQQINAKLENIGTPSPQYIDTPLTKISVAENRTEEMPTPSRSNIQKGEPLANNQYNKVDIDQEITKLNKVTKVTGENLTPEILAKTLLQDKSPDQQTNILYSAVVDGNKEKLVNALKQQMRENNFDNKEITNILVEGEKAAHNVDTVLKDKTYNRVKVVDDQNPATKGLSDEFAKEMPEEFAKRVLQNKSISEQADILYSAIKDENINIVQSLENQMVASGQFTKKQVEQIETTGRDGISERFQQQLRAERFADFENSIDLKDEIAAEKRREEGKDKEPEQQEFESDKGTKEKLSGDSFSFDNEEKKVGTPTKTNTERDSITDAIRSEILEKQQIILQDAIAETIKDPVEKEKFQQLSAQEFREYLKTAEGKKAAAEQHQKPEIKAKLNEVSSAGYKKVHEGFKDSFRDVSWEGNKDTPNIKSSQIKNEKGELVADIKETTHSIKPVSLTLEDGTSKTVSSYRTIDFPPKLEKENGPLHLSMALKDENGKNMPENGALYFTAHYDQSGKLTEVSSPTPVKFMGKGDDAVGYIEKDGKVFTLPVNQGKYKEMMREVEVEGHSVNLSQEVETKSVDKVMTKEVEKKEKEKPKEPETPNKGVMEETVAEKGEQFRKIKDGDLKKAEVKDLLSDAIQKGDKEKVALIVEATKSGKGHHEVLTQDDFQEVYGKGMNAGKNATTKESQSKMHDASEVLLPEAKITLKNHKMLVEGNVESLDNFLTLRKKMDVKKPEGKGVEENAPTKGVMEKTVAEKGEEITKSLSEEKKEKKPEVKSLQDFVASDNKKDNLAQMDKILAGKTQDDVKKMLVDEVKRGHKETVEGIVEATKPSRTDKPKETPGLTKEDFKEAYNRGMDAGGKAPNVQVQRHIHSAGFKLTAEGGIPPMTHELKVTVNTKALNRNQDQGMSRK